MTEEERNSYIDWCTQVGFSNKKIEIILRCLEHTWYVINSNINDITGEPMYAGSVEVLKDAEFILECINYYIYN